MGDVGGSPLGKATVYSDRYAPELLYAVDRAPQRADIGLGASLPFAGVDAWTAWEAGWLDGEGRPRVAVLRFDVPATSPAIVESKSVKLYLTALNDTRFDAPRVFRDTVARDLSAATGAPVAVSLVDVGDLAGLARHPLAGTSIDDAPLQDGDAARAASPEARPDAGRLRVLPGHAEETLVTRLFRSVCPVTGQPDYAQVAIRYRGRALDHGALLAYLLAFRHHPGFHEHCVERVFVDLAGVAAPAALAVTARFTRRGGIDINPLRWRGGAGPPQGFAPAPTLQQ